MRGVRGLAGALNSERVLAAMHGKMTGWHEIRLSGPGREQFRLFCLLENGDYECGLHHQSPTPWPFGGGCGLGYLVAGEGHQPEVQDVVLEFR